MRRGAERWGWTWSSDMWNVMDEQSSLAPNLFGKGVAILDRVA